MTTCRLSNDNINEYTEKLERNGTAKKNTLQEVRKYINSAVYIESNVSDAFFPKYQNSFANAPENDTSNGKLLRVKRCSCISNRNECPCHGINAGSNTDLEFENLSQSSLHSSETETTLKVNENPPNEIKESSISITPSMSTCYMTFDDQQRDIAFRQWCEKKANEKKKQEAKQARIAAEKEQQRQKLIEIERENFRRWLAKKKQQDEIRKNKEQKKLVEELSKKEMMERRNSENELHYQLWLKRKEEQELERKIKEQMEMMRKTEERQRRIEENTRVYEEWLRSSKNKPKPIPLNQGLKSLKSVLSVTYINPTPWIPNVENKPISQ